MLHSLAPFCLLDILIIVILLCSLYQSNLRPPIVVDIYIHNSQLGGLFAEIGNGWGFFGPRKVPLCCPICKETQTTLTLYQLLLLVKYRSVSMQCSHI